MKRIITAVAIVLASIFATSVSAQSGYQVKGVVVDAQGPVIGATVMEKGTTNGTSTGLDGDYTLTVSSPAAVIEISCIGYATQTFAASQLPKTITLLEDTEFLDDVVVIGYGTVKKTDMTGSVSTVKADQVNKGMISSPSQLLAGKSSGVVVTAGDGQPGSASTIRIRGGSSLNATNDPLVVIDGLPVGGTGISGVSDALSSIGAAVGIGGAILLGQRWAVLDPLASIVVGGMLVKVAWDLLRESTGELTDSSLSAETEREIEEIIRSFPQVSEPHNLRTRRIGNRIAIESHVRLDGGMTLDEAHDIVSAIEDRIRERFGHGTIVTIHMEPVKKG